MKSSESSSVSSIPKIMVFRPTLEEMKDFSKYLEFMESKGAHHGGLAKIIPPPEWVPRKAGYDNLNFTIKSPIEQIVNVCRDGVYTQYNIQRRSMNFREFKRLAMSAKYRTPDFFDYDDLERKYWKNIAYNPPIYGADVPGSLTDKDCKEFNINNLNTILDMINDSYGIKIMGVNTAYLYFGMWKSSFAWHTEDMDLYSINYLHFGAPKSWYCVPPEYGKKLEKVANDCFPELSRSCPAFLRHKMTLISPQVLRKSSIPYNKITQEQGEFMITFPYSYHAGYNHGLNCAESTNFALQRWIEFGKRATVCHCREDTVKINMDIFVKVFQAERYQKWLEGKDIGPDPKDPTNICAAPSPYELENEYLEKTSKPKRYKRQIANNSDDHFEECIDLFCDDEDQDTDNSPDFGQTRNDHEKNYKSKKKPKVNNNNNKSNSTNGTINCDSQTRSIDNNVRQGKNQSADKKVELSTFGMEAFDFDGPIKSFEELSYRTLQYIGNPKAFGDEVLLNYYFSLIDPFCSICLILRTFHFSQDLSRVRNDLKPPFDSRILIPKALFTSKSKNNSSNFLDNQQNYNQSILLVCSACKLCVHSSCYGADVSNHNNNQDWKCDRCAANDLDAVCCLCPLRGGALKITTCNQWAHITCSLVLSNIKLDNDLSLKPIDITAVQPFLEKSDRTICCFCSKKWNCSQITNYIVGCCARCHNSNTCLQYFHVSCAYREGVLFELNDNLTFKMTCDKCQSAKLNKGRDFLQENVIELDLGMTVIAKYDTNCYSYAKVVNKFQELLHHVQFVGRLVTNIGSHEILNRDCEKDPPAVGDLVEAIWNKQQLHGTYAGSHSLQMYTVQFDDGTNVSLSRDDLHMLDEEFPKRVQSRFTYSLRSP